MLVELLVHECRLHQCLAVIEHAIHLEGCDVLTLALFHAFISNRRLRNAKSRINTAFFVVKIKYLLKIYGKIEFRETSNQST